MNDPRPLASALADRSPAVRAAARGRLVAGGTDPASAYRALLDKPPGRGLRTRAAHRARRMRPRARSRRNCTRIWTPTSLPYRRQRPVPGRWL
ncbi:hypothetical protein ACU686_29025 [Yinghuangia aomiensis]